MDDLEDDEEEFICLECGVEYDGYGDGYDGLCPDCADKAFNKDEEDEEDEDQ